MVRRYRLRLTVARSSVARLGSLLCAGANLLWCSIRGPLWSRPKGAYVWLSIWCVVNQKRIKVKSWPLPLLSNPTIKLSEVKGRRFFIVPDGCLPLRDKRPATKGERNG